MSKQQKEVTTDSKQVALSATDIALLREGTDSHDDITAADITIPRILILQSNSPQLSPGDSEYLEHAKQGDFLVTTLNKVISGKVGAKIVPIGFRQRFIEWGDRATGGGLIASHATMPAGCKAVEGGKLESIDGNNIVKTAEYACFLLDDDGVPIPLFLSLASTQFKKSRQWNFAIQNRVVKGEDGVQFRPPMFSQIYLATTKPETNNRGSWFGWNIVRHGDLLAEENGKEIFEAAKGVRADFIAGSLDPAPMTPAITASEGQSSAADADDDTPF